MTSVADRAAAETPEVTATGDDARTLAAPAGMTVICLGAGNAHSRRQFSTSFAIGTTDDTGKSRWLLIDCPHPLRRMLGALEERTGISLDVADLDAIVLTHIHADHSSGLESIGFHSRYVDGRRLTLAAHPRVSERLWAGHLAAGMERPLSPWWAGDRCSHTCDEQPEIEEDHAFEDYYTLLDLPQREPTTIGPFTIEVRQTLHVVATTAVRVTAGGQTFAYSADTAYDEDLIAWLAEGDLVAHECGTGIHTPYECLAALPAELRARMRLVHYDDDLDIDDGAITRWHDSAICRLPLRG